MRKIAIVLAALGVATMLSAAVLPAQAHDWGYGWRMARPPLAPWILRLPLLRPIRVFSGAGPDIRLRLPLMRPDLVLPHRVPRWGSTGSLFLMLIGAFWHRLRAWRRDKQRLLYLAVTFGGLLSGRLVSLALDGGIAGYGHTIVALTRLLQAALRWPLLRLFFNTGVNATLRARDVYESRVG